MGPVIGEIALPDVFDYCADEVLIVLRGEVVEILGAEK
jgi:hypothetical protein